ncbi:MAG: hypothetical protein IID09_06510, partial [Candidatus Hydrogenedentes bacterium]|nr:hypothetical protein [Candidatus Hydrogenedentota bacterium]
STHPPIAERVKILRSIGGTVTYGAYQEAWGKTSGAKADRLPQSALSDTERGGAVRKAGPRSKRKSPRQQMRETGDLLRNINKFIFLPCVCGLKLKLPPDFKHDKVTCPKCSREHTVPIAQLAAAAAIADNLPADSAEKVGRAARPPKLGKTRSGETLKMKRQPGEWMTFKCTCGATKTLSPGFAATRMTCKKCGRTIEIE